MPGLAGLALLVAVGVALVFFGPSASAMTFNGGDPTPTIASDLPDYPPGATVTLSGSNWAPGETVHIVVNDEAGQTWKHTADVVAADDGAIADQFQLPNWFVAVYDVTATGSLSGTATWSFTDATKVNNLAVSPTPITASQVAKYTIDFDTTNALSATAGDTVTVTFPSGTTVPATIAAANVRINNTAPASAPVVSGLAVTVTVPAAVAAGAHVTLVLGSTTPVITNPPGGAYTLMVKTSTDTANQNSASYTINAPPTATVALSPKPPKTNDTLTATATKADVNGDTVTLTYVWKVNGVIKKTTSGSASLTDTFSLATAGNGDRGDTVTVEVTPNDGKINGTVASDTTTVANMPPTATAQAQATPEDTAKTITLTGADVDTADVLRFKITTLPAHGSLANAANGHVVVAGDLPYLITGTDVVFTPSANYNGADGFQFLANDGTADSAAPASVSLTISAVNDAPSFVKGADQALLEDSGAKTVTGWATAISPGPSDEAGQTVSFQVTNDSAGLFSVQPAISPNGTLTYTPAADANGSATVTVQAKDSGGTANGGVDTSAAQTFTIAVTAVNDAPTFTKGANQTLLEDAGAQTVSGWATGISPGPSNEAGQTVSFQVSNDNAGLFSAQPAIGSNGTLTYTSAANANGSATVTVQAKDSGGTSNGGVDTSALRTFTLTVNPVNDPPVASDTAVDVPSNNVATFAPLVGDVETSNANLTYAIVSPPSKGTLTAGSTNGSFTYHANAVATGTDTATYKVTDRGDPDNCGTATATCDAAASSTVRTITFTLPATNAPPVTSGLQLWFDSDTVTQADGQPVSTWSDASGLGRDLTAAPGAAATMRSNAVNGHAALDFDGVSSMLKSYGSTFTIAQPDTFFIVYRALDPSTAGRAFVFDSTDSGNRQVFGRSGQYSNRLYANQDFDAQGVSFPYANFQIWSGTFDGTNSTMYQNGSLVAIGNAGTSSLAGLALGGLSTDGANGYDRGHSQIANLLVYSGALTDAQRQSITEWLNQKYGVIGLPSGPVNTTAPSLAGRPVEGQTLTAAPGAWLGTPPITYAYETRRCDAAGGNCVVVGTGPSYTVGTGDIGSTIRLAVTATNSVGSATAVSVPTAVVTPAPNVNGDAPPVTAGLQMWFDASHETYADGASVTRFSDLSGSGRDLTSGFPDQAPTFRANAVNGKPALEFDGIRSLLKTYGSTFTLAQPDTFFIVYDQLDSQEAYVFDSANSSQRQLLGRGPSGELEMYANNALTVSNPPIPFPGFQLWSGTYNGASSDVYKNGSLMAQGDAGLGPLSGFTVGALSSGSLYGYNYSHSLVSAILWYSGTLTDSQRQAVTSWLNQRYQFVPKPTATLTAPTIATSGTAFTFSLDDAQGPSTDLHYAFSCDGSSLDAVTYSTASTQSSTTCTLASGTPTRTILARVISPDDQYTEYSAILTVVDPPTATLTAADTVVEGSSIHVSLDGATSTSQQARDAGFTFAFDCGAGYGAFGAANAVDCPTSDNGSVTVRARVKDTFGNSTEYTKAITVENAAPVVTAPVAQTGSEGAPGLVSLGSFADAGVADGPWQVAIDWGDTTSSSFAALGAGDLGTLTHTYGDNGTYHATVTVTDKDSGTGSATFDVTVANVAPTAVLAATSPVAEGSASTLSLTSAFDPSSADTAAGFTRTYSCNGTTYAATASCTFNDNGSYTVYGRIADKDGGISSYSTSVTVTNVAPTLTAPAAQSASEGSTATFALGTFVDPGTGDSPWAVDVDWGDGLATHYTTATTGAISRGHAYLRAGSYTASVTVTDKDSAASAARTFAVSVTNVAPTLTVPLYDVATEGTAQALALGSFNDVGAGDGPWSIDVNWGDGSTHTTFQMASTGVLPAASHTYPDNGTYTVTESVSDAAGGADTKTFPVNVSNSAPTLTPPAAQSGNEGQSTLFSLPSFADLGAGDAPWSVDVNWGDGTAHTTFQTSTTGALGTATHGYADSGSFTATVTVTDKDGGAGATTFAVTTLNVAPTATLGAVGTFAEGTPGTIGFSAQYDPASADMSAGFTYTFACDGVHFGAPTSSSSATCTYPDNGSYTVAGTIADKDGGVTSYTSVVSVTNVAPTAVFAATSPVAEGSASTLSLTGAFDPSSADTAAGFTRTYSCDGTTYTATASCTFADNGTFTVYGRIADKNGGASTYTASVTVTNVAPTATFAAVSPVGEGSATALSLTGAFDPSSTDTTAGFTRTYSCNGTTYTATASCTFVDNGTYTVYGRIADKDGGTSSYSTTVTVTNVAPTLTPATGQTAAEGASTMFALGSFADPGTTDAPWTIDVTWGDGSAASHFTVSSLGAISQAHAYADNGSYTVSTTVTDKDGGISATRTFTATVSNVAPSLTAPAAQTANEGSAKAFDLGSYADPGANDAPWSVDVNWGDGSAHSTFTSSARGALGTSSHTYDDNGSYTMTVKVTDKDGGTGTSTSTVVVANVAPSAALNAPSVDEGSAIALSLTGGTDPSSADTAAGFTYAFDCGGGYGSFGAASTASCPTTDNGTRTVRGEIKDKDGGVTEYTKSVTIANVAPAVTAADQSASEGSAATLALGSFTDPGADNPWGVDVAWGDGSAHYTATAAAPGALGSQSHTYADSGSYTVTVKVTDKDGGIGTSTFTVTVANVEPSASLPATASAFVNIALQLTFSAATDPSAPDTAAGFHYAYDCNNGSLAAATYATAGTSNTIACTWASTGTYTVRGRIIDKDGGFTESTTVVTVAISSPTVTFATGTTSIAEGTAASTQYAYSFTVANGTTVTSATAGCGTLGTLVAGSLTYSNTAVSFKCTFNTTDGTATSVSTLTANVTRNDGATGSGSRAVSITNVAPVPTLTAPSQFATYLVNSTVMLSGAFTDPGPDSVWKVHVDWGDATVSDLSVTSKSYATTHTYRAASPASPGYTTITVTVTDKDGGAGTTSRIIYVK